VELGPPSLRDLAAYGGLFLDPTVAKWLRPPPLRPMGEGDVLALLERDIQHWRQHGWGPWVVRSDGAFAGRAGLCWTLVEGKREVEIAWSIVPALQGRGLATAAAERALERAREIPLDRVIALTLVENLASRRVMEKAGLVFQREVTHAGLPHVLYDAVITGQRGST
jgi:RimJ/RimL family protein N-acetyltransferase